MRWLLGAFEAGLFPGVTYYLSWYARLSYRECEHTPLMRRSCAVGTVVRSTDFALPFSSPPRRSQGHSVAYSQCVSRSLSKPLRAHVPVLSIRQAGLSQLAGVGGKGGWAWIFIIEGLITVVAGVFSFFIIQDFPDTARFLTEEERTFVVRRLQADGQISAAGEKLKWRYVWQAMTDWKTWLGSRS